MARHKYLDNEYVFLERIHSKLAVPGECNTFSLLIFRYCKFGKDCVGLIFAFLAFSLRRKIKICND